jgi:reactive intermediate/imine deaminase
MRLTALAALLAGAGVLGVHAQPQPAPQGPPLSRVVTAGGLVYVSGILPMDAGGRVIGVDIREQTRVTLERMQGALGEAGASLKDAASISVYLTRAEDFGAMNEVYRTFFADAPPVRTTVVANLMVPEALIEISAIAAAPGTTRRAIHPEGWQPSPNPYSYIVEAGDTVFLAGLIARNPRDNSFQGGDLAGQSRAVLENARVLLEAAGLGFEQVVSARVFLTDMAAREQMNRVYRTYFPADPPARATVGVALMQPAYLVEMTFVASRLPKRAIAGDGAPNPNLSAAIRAGDRLYVAGMLGNTAETRGDVGAQTRETLRRIERTLGKAGYGWSDVAESLVYLRRAGALASMNAAYRDLLRPPYPARTTVEAAFGSPDAEVEIMMTAVKGASRR